MTGLSSYDLAGLVEKVREHTGGEVDRSIPALASADADLVAVALVSVDGEVAASDDAGVLFSLQSAVKPFLFALALADSDGAALDRVGIEPTGEAFDAIKLESGTGRPPNPMVVELTSQWRVFVIVPCR